MEVLPLFTADDLVLEDSVEDGETLLGDGKSGLFAKASVAEIIPAAYAHGAISQSRSSRKSKGLSGPGTSSLDVSCHWGCFKHTCDK